MSNFINDGLRTYGMLKQMDRQEAAGKREEERFELAKSDRATNQQRQQKIDARNDEKYERETKAFNFEAAKSEATLILAKQAAARKSGKKYSPSDNELMVMQRNPLLNIDFLMSDEVGQSLEVADKVKQNPHLFSTPEAANALTVLSPEINKGSAGNKRISRIMEAPTADHLVFELDIDGNRAPMTEDRQVTQADSKIKQVPVESIMDRVNSVAQMRNMVMSDEGQSYLANLYSELGMGDKPAQLTELGKLYSERNALPEGSSERKTYDRMISNKTSKAAGSNGGSPAPADIRSAKLYQKELEKDGVKITFKDAYRQTNMAKEAPERFVSDYIKAERSEQESQMLDPTDEKYKDRETLTREALDALNKLRARVGENPVKSNDVEKAISDSFQESIKPTGQMKRNGNSVDDFLSDYL